MMKKNVATAWPMPSENSLTAFSSSHSRRPKRAIVKQLSLPSPPDEATIQALNAMAGQHPFCRYYKVKKHDTL